MQLRRPPDTHAPKKALLIARINSLDVKAAQTDIMPFLKSQDSVTAWSREFFSQLAEMIITA